ncbi:MAG: PTS fructose transporter subunit IIA [Gammaproteobacteria bacterium]|nr:PTS fructose transporter subunit IIA [Gammaproteobacteria bacterium]
MSIGLLTITHNNIGHEVLAAAQLIVAKKPLKSESIGVKTSDDPTRLLEKTEQLLEQLDSGDGVLILTDIFGSTPCNIAKQLSHKHQLQVLGGLNLAMMVRIFNYANLPLDQLTEKAIEGAHNGIMQC